MPSRPQRAGKPRISSAGHATAPDSGTVHWPAERHALDMTACPLGSRALQPTTSFWTSRFATILPRLALRTGLTRVFLQPMRKLPLFLRRPKRSPFGSVSATRCNYFPPAHSGSQRHSRCAALACSLRCCCWMSRLRHIALKRRAHAFLIAGHPPDADRHRVEHDWTASSLLPTDHRADTNGPGAEQGTPGRDPAPPQCARRYLARTAACGRWGPRRDRRPAARRTTPPYLASPHHPGVSIEVRPAGRRPAGTPVPQDTTLGRHAA